MIAVPEIEVPIEHQHFVALQILERLLANYLSIHAVWDSGGRVNDLENCP